MEFLYKTSGQEWLINLLKNGKLKTINKDWISLSLVENSGGQDDYGKMTITFDKYMIMSEPNAYEVDYEDPDFFDMFPTITRHITGFNNEQEYYDNIGYANAEEANEDGELTWMQNINSYETEQEVVLDEIKYKDGLIINVEFNEEPEQELIDLLKLKNILYTNNMKENKTMKYVKNLFKNITINESKIKNVIFYFDSKNNETIAVFEDEKTDNIGNCTCFTDNNKFTSCNIYYIKTLELATQQQYKNIQQQLEDFGYILNILN